MYWWCLWGIPSINPDREHCIQTSKPWLSWMVLLLFLNDMGGHWGIQPVVTYRHTNSKLDCVEVDYFPPLNKTGKFSLLWLQLHSWNYLPLSCQKSKKISVLCTEVRSKGHLEGVTFFKRIINCLVPPQAYPDYSYLSINASGHRKINTRHITWDSIRNTEWAWGLSLLILLWRL